jgi:hypothetical protein
LDLRTVEAGTDEDTPGGRKAQTIFGLEELNLSQNGLQVHLKRDLANRSVQKTIFVLYVDKN